jgi:hypothetical protein
MGNETEGAFDKGLSTAGDTSLPPYTHAKAGVTLLRMQPYRRLPLTVPGSVISARGRTW